MNNSPDIHNRRSIRMNGYDYSQPGIYFITLVTQDSVCLFNAIVHDEMLLNNAGKMIMRIRIGPTEFNPRRVYFLFVFFVNIIAR